MKSGYDDAVFHDLDGDCRYCYADDCFVLLPGNRLSAQGMGGGNEQGDLHWDHAGSIGDYDHHGYSFRDGSYYDGARKENHGGERYCPNDVCQFR